MESERVFKLSGFSRCIVYAYEMQRIRLIILERDREIDLFSKKKMR